LILALAMSLAACSAQPQEVPVISYDQAKSELVALVEDTAELVGGEWTIERFEGEGWCNYAEGVDGKNYAAWRSALPSGDPQVLAEQVQADWESRGFEVTTRFTPDPDLYDVIIHGPGGFSVSFGSSEKTMILSGQSVCIRAE
jgi:hypothetical protein